MVPVSLKAAQTVSPVADAPVVSGFYREHQLRALAVTLTRRAET
jgi:hypothetical protein